MVGANDGLADGDIDGVVLGNNDKDGVDDGFSVGVNDGKALTTAHLWVINLE